MRNVLVSLCTSLFELCAVMVGMATTIIWKYVKASGVGVILLRRTRRFGRVDSDSMTGIAQRDHSDKRRHIDAMQLDSMDYLCCPACKGELRLTSEERTETEVTQGSLDCLGCERRFVITDGLPNLIFPETLAGSDLSSQLWYDQRPEYDPRLWAFRLGIWDCAFRETRTRRQVIDRLQVKKGVSVLETAVGNGINLPIIADQLGEEGRLHGLDISSRSLKVANKRMRAKGVQVELIQGNASYLPYKAARFDAVLHVGAFNEFGEKRRAIEEMYRVAKPGAKIVICDEGLAPGREKTLLGKWVLKSSPFLFAHKPPLDLAPTGIQDRKVQWVWQGTYWVIEFRKELQH